MIDNLNGYLQCLARLCGNGYVFEVTGYTASSDLDEFIQELLDHWNEGGEYADLNKFTYSGKRLIDYKTLIQEVEGFVFNGLLNRERIPSEVARKNITQLLTEDINEYYGLLSTGLNKDGAFHPLISGSVYRLFVNRTGFSQELHLLSKIETVYVVTHYAKK